MEAAIDITGAIAVISTILALTRRNPVRGLLYLIVSLLAVAAVFGMLGAAFAAALEVIIYAGAIIVLFLFVMMMLNLGEETIQQERKWMTPSMWLGPGILAVLLFIEILSAGKTELTMGGSTTEISATMVGQSVFGPYIIAVELASLLLLSGLVGAYHLGRDTRHTNKDKEARNES